MKIVTVLALFMVSILTLVTAAADETQLKSIDFGDFTMTFDPNTPGSINAKESGQIFATIYYAYLPEGDRHTCLTIAWLDLAAGYGSYTLEQMKSHTDAIKQQTMERQKEYYEFLSFENGDFSHVVIDGMPGFSYVSEVSRRNVPDGPDGPITNIVTRYYLIDSEHGTYVFQTMSDSMEKIEKYSDPIIHTIRWKTFDQPADDGSKQIELYDFTITIPSGWDYTKSTGGDVVIHGTHISDLNSFLFIKTGEPFDYISLFAAPEGAPQLAEKMQQEIKDFIPDGRGYSFDGPVEFLIDNKIAIEGTIHIEQADSIGIIKVLYVTRGNVMYCFTYTTINDESIAGIYEPMIQSVHWK